MDADGPDNIYGTEDDDLRLSAGSPCIDAADNTAVPADSADLDEDGDTTERTPLDLNGKHRFLNDVSTTDTGVSDPPDYPEIVDMGAYEYQCIIFVDTMAPGADDGTTWEDAYKYLQDGLADAAVSGKETRVAQGTYRPDENNANPTGTGNQMATFFLINGTVTNCTFSGNSAGGNGGGMHNHNSSPMLTNCVFIANSVDHTSGQGGTVQQPVRQ